MSKTKSGIFYQGASIIDGSPIVGVMLVSSSNGKTGNMVQTYIIRSDMDPITANRKGKDYAICGNCPHKGTVNPAKTTGLAENRTCYVNLGQGALQVYKSFALGKYPVLSTEDIINNVSNRMVRIGTYGDGYAIPNQVWQLIKDNAAGITAYTHQETNNEKFYMKSADSLEFAKKAWESGYRTFRIVSDYSQKQNNEIACPSEKGVKCIDCGLCDGTKQAKNIVIQVHGSGKKHFTTV
jgi:hypothetical protein